MLPLLPCLTTFNTVGYINKRELNIVRVLVVYYIVCSFPVLLLRVGSGNVAFVRIRSTMSALSSSWTRSSSLRDLRQDDHTLEITSIFAC